MTLDRLDELADAEVGTDANEEVDLVGRDLELDDLGVYLLAYLGEDLLQTRNDASSLVVDDDRSSVLRAPHDVVGGGEYDVAVGAGAREPSIKTACSHALRALSAKADRCNYRLRVSPVQEREILAEWDGVRFVGNRFVEKT